LYNNKKSNSNEVNILKIGILGATGYAGQNLVWLIKHHPNVNLSFVTSRSFNGIKYSDIYPNMNGLVDLECIDTSNINPSLVMDTDLVFLALPHKSSMNMVKQLLNVNPGIKIIDLSADFRLSDPNVYEKWYKTPHEMSHLINNFAFGLPEIHAESIKKSSYVANPGCYPTASILALAPAMDAGLIESDIIVDAKSGVSGAGRSANTANLYCEVNESVKAYGLFSHRHTPEIAQELSLLGGKPTKVIFTPHLVPMNRGILSTCYARLKKNISTKEMTDIYKNYYEGKPFVRVLENGMLPQTRNVRQSNYCDIGLAVDKDSSSLIAVSAIDNLMKGAASQAVQNMNLMCGYDQKAGLDFTPMAP
jgi:N-acetyl-gamma-glutamyl-phosphate reductase